MPKIIEVSFPGGKRVDAKINETVVHTDQAVDHGGGGTAPEPFQIFLASIATCAGIYALQFCQSRQLPSEGLSLTMTCDLDPATKMYTKMALELKLPAGFPEKYEAAILRAMDLCAVKKHINNPPAFELRAVRPAV
jgi:putative redox protein